MPTVNVRIARPPQKPSHLRQAGSPCSLHLVPEIWAAKDHQGARFGPSLKEWGFGVRRRTPRRSLTLPVGLGLCGEGLGGGCATKLGDEGKARGGQSEGESVKLFQPWR